MSATPDLRREARGACDPTDRGQGPPRGLLERARDRGPPQVLHVVQHFLPEAPCSGVVAFVSNLLPALAEAGAQVSLATTRPFGAEAPPGVHAFERAPALGRGLSPGFARYVGSALAHGTVDLVHVHSMFSFATAFAARAARRAGIPYVVSPHGCCRPGALAHHPLRKAAFFRLVELGHLRGAAALHAMSEPEAGELSSFIPGKRVFVVPGGVASETGSPSPERNPLRLVFLGRLHPVKGLDVLVAALSRLEAVLPGVETVVAGPDDAGQWARIERLSARMRPRPRLRYVGPVHGADKARLLGSAAALVLPSRSECFGQVVLEALASGTPVIVSRASPWKAVQEAGAGAWVEGTPDAFAEAIAMLLRSPERGAARAAAARRFAAMHTWAASAQRMMREYDRILAAARWHAPRRNGWT